MPSMSRKYCLTTSPRKMGFSQKASCKAQGLLKRTSKKHKGKYIISSKYKNKKKRRDGSLYSNGRSKPRTKTGYGDSKRAKETLRNIKKFDKAYQMQVVTTMYNRAKYHANQTEGMRDAMKLFKKWLKSRKRN
jgi:hypothetical protein